MPTQDTEDRREYYRIEDMIALEILPPDATTATPNGNSPQLFDLVGELHRLDFEAQHLLRQIAENNRTLANYLKVQNRRIELLGQAVAQDLLDDIGPPRRAMLSEGGINFTHDQPLPEGSEWLFRLVLMPQALGMLLSARIASCVALADGAFAIGSSFEALTDAQRQLLARHILQKQATERRLALDNLHGD